MKLCLFFILFFTLGLSANVNGQQERVNLDLKDVSIKSLFEEIQKQTNMFFVFSSEQTKEFGNLTIKANNESVKEVLDRIFLDTGFNYNIDGDLIIVRKSENTTPQESVVLKGTVRDTKGVVVPGVTVSIKGTTLGVATNIRGEYNLRVSYKESLTLCFSFIGMTTVEMELKHLKPGENREKIDVTLTEAESELEDVVVTGYANVRKSSFTGSVTQIDGAEALKISNSNLIDVLQVFDPSLRIAENNEMGSDPNTLPEFYIRGRSSIEGVSELDLAIGTDVSQYALATNPNLPIFIMDGFEVTVQKIYDFDISRIKNITILKDAAATAIYGSRASNGVIVIETLAPRPGQLKFGYKGDFSITAPDLSSYNLMNAKDLLDAEVAAGLFDVEKNPGAGSTSYGASKEKIQLDLIKSFYNKQNNVLRGVDSYWLSQPLSTMVNHAHSVNIEGGAESVRFGVDLNYNNQNGVMKKSVRERIGAGLIVDYYFRTMQIRNKVEYQIVNSKDSPYGSFSDYTSMKPYDHWKDEDDNYRKNLTQWVGGGNTNTNPLYEAQINNFNKKRLTELSNNLSINWYATDHLQFKGQVAVTIGSDDGKKFTDPASGKYSGGSNANLFQKGELVMTKTDSYRWNFNLFGAYNRMFGRHNVNASLGINATINNREYSNSHYRGFPDAERNSPAYAYEIVRKPTFTDNKTRLLGGFLNVNYSFKDIYLFLKFAS